MLKVKSGENPLNENNQTGIASLLDYKVYSGQLSEIVVLQSKMFLIVEYIIGEDETKVEVVPSSWYSSGQCWWPPDEFARSTLEKKVSESVDCDKTTWDCYDGLLIATFKTYTEAKAKLALAIEGELVTPSSTDIDGHKKVKRVKQRTKRYLEETSENSDNEIRKNKDNSQKKQKKCSPERPYQQGPGSVHYSDTHITLPLDLNALNISSLFSPQSSNEDSNINTRTESTEHERSNIFDGGNGFSDDSMSSLVIHPRQQLAAAGKSTPNSPEMNSKKIGVILHWVKSLARGLEVVKDNQREVLELLTLPLKNSSPPQPDCSITELFQLPMKTFNDVNNVSKLLRDQNNASKMRTFFIEIGGTTSSIVGRVMSSIMTYECGRSCFCFFGLNAEKVAFNSTPICEIVIGECIEYKEFLKCTML
uniref:Uncharacterized protein n=1 Tax=Daphnia galeata TaxID=27404 RepID=A0A8J2W9M7_9CRUS|nr:unnamed protein product [Daphnia galeata]